MDVEEAYAVVCEHMRTNPGRFYGVAGDLDVGAGLIYDGVLFPMYAADRRLFGTKRGPVYVLTHECDVAQENRRPFNDDVVICPLVPLEEFVHRYSSSYDEASLAEFLVQIVKRHVFRLVYFPPLADRFPYGALMFMNQVCSTKLEVFEFDGVERLGALSAYGLREIDFFLENQFLRPKDQLLSFTIH